MVKLVVYRFLSQIHISKIVLCVFFPLISWVFKMCARTKLLSSTLGCWVADEITLTIIFNLDISPIFKRPCVVDVVL